MTSIKSQLRDWYIKGHQLQRCYIEDWENIQNVFKHYKLELNNHGPIMTINELHNVVTARNITENIKYRYPEYRPKDIFIALLRAYPAYSRKLGMANIKPLIPNIPRLMAIKGTIKETEGEFEVLIDKIMEEYNEKPNNINRPYINISFRK